VQERAEYSSDDQPIPKQTPLYSSGLGLADKPKRKPLPKTNKRARHVVNFTVALERVVRCPLASTSAVSTTVLPPDRPQSHKGAKAP
jgi:hypothetical protein